MLRRKRVAKQFDLATAGRVVKRNKYIGLAEVAFVFGNFVLPNEMAAKCVPRELADEAMILVHIVATLRPAGPELEIEAAAEVDQRRLGMTYRLMGLVGAPTRLAVRGRLVADSEAA